MTKTSPRKSPHRIRSKSFNNRRIVNKQRDGSFRHRRSRRYPRTKGEKSQAHFHCRNHDPTRRGFITNWCERRVMERKENTYLLNEYAFQNLICQNLVTCPNENAGTSHSGVSEKRETIGRVALAAFAALAEPCWSHPCHRSHRYRGAKPWRSASRPAVSSSPPR